MIENMESFLNSYGYFAVFIGTFIEGELFLLVAGFFIRHEFLQPLPTFIFSILGALTHELIYFFLGRWKGRHILLGNKYTKRRYKKAKKLVEKYGIFSLFIIRFIYGMRVVPMMLMGATGFNLYKFLFFNILSLIIWATIFLSLGYFLGHIAITLFGDLKHYYLIFGLTVVFVGLLVYLFYALITRNKKEVKQ
ncbi:DedA family protein [Sulfurihydrogenibium sp.]|uniref:DedA family protein n=1 Tax=Sulfurihydrogenibium sp. TaxID=2053621 RepID=UPI00263321BF|nr:DedA family protein [Sulfurihydrogenibium sp.]